MTPYLLKKENTQTYAVIEGILFTEEECRLLRESQFFISEIFKLIPYDWIKDVASGL